MKVNLSSPVNDIQMLWELVLTLVQNVPQPMTDQGLQSRTVYPGFVDQFYSFDKYLSCILHLQLALSS